MNGQAFQKQPVDPNQIALCIQQPWAELILRGIKTIEVRHSLAKPRESVLIYASKKTSPLPAARLAIAEHELDVNQLPFGTVVGSVDIIEARKSQSSDARAACLRKSDLTETFSWVLENPKRFEAPIPAKHVPYGIWFYPFRRKKKRNET